MQALCPITGLLDVLSVCDHILGVCIFVPAVAQRVEWVVAVYCRVGGLISGF